MTRPKINAEVSVGNIVSWSLVAIGFIAGYVKLEANANQTIKDVETLRATTKENRTYAEAIKNEAGRNDALMTDKVSLLATDVAVVKSEIRAMHKDVGDQFKTIIDNQKAILDKK